MSTRRLRWVQWGKIDLERGLGGVEVHARALHQELLQAGVESHLTSDLLRLTSEPWDVIQTHGTTRLPDDVRYRLPVRTRTLHTLHGTAWGRISACREWLWPGGYWAAFVEIEAVLRSDFVAAVHPHLWLYSWARRVKPKGRVFVCGNGWDSASVPEALPEPLQARLNGLGRFWLYIGRGHDLVKNVGVLQQVFERRKGKSVLLAVPGDGFTEIPGTILHSGVLSSGQVRSLLQDPRASGLLLSSLYEGMPLVVLEALGQGLPVITSNVGGVRVLSSELQGLVRLDQNHLQAFEKALEAFEGAPLDRQTRAQREERNRPLLSSWQDVAQRYLLAMKINQRL